MNEPLFSCVVPVKGDRRFLAEAIDSLYAQAMADELEIIVQDGDVESDAGQSDALNKGFAKARGKWFFWLNADDLLLPGALKKVASIIQTSKPLWIAGNQIYIDDKGRIIRGLRANKWHDGLYRHVVPHVNGPSAFFSRELFEQVGGFDVSLQVCMDWDLWIRFMKAGARFCRIDEYLWAMRQWSGSKTQGRLRSAAWHRQEVARMLAKNGFKVTWFGLCRFRLWRLLDGSYLRGWLDTLKLKGRKL